MFGRFCYTRLLLSRRRKCSRPSLRLTQKRLTQVPHGRVCVYKLDWVPAGWIFSCRVGWGGATGHSDSFLERQCSEGGGGRYWPNALLHTMIFQYQYANFSRRRRSVFPDGGGGTCTIVGAQIAMQTADLQTKATAIEDHSSRRLLINSLQFT